MPHETVADLLRALADLGAGELYRDEDGRVVLNLDGEFADTPVRVAWQPNYPLAANLANVQEHEGRVWLAASEGTEWHENPYAPSEAWQEV